MEFVNHTPFPAMAFAGVDVEESAFHVVVLRQTLTWNDPGELIFTDEQQPLCEADEFFEDAPLSGPRQESDLCPYKPRCDVIVNATAYPPLSGARQFEVRLEVQRPDTPAPLPTRPAGLNPYMAPPSEAMDAWRQEMEAARNSVIPGEHLIDKTLLVTGERHLVKRGWLGRMASKLLQIGTLGLVKSRMWRLTDPQPATAVPLRLDRAFGGQCRINAGSKAAAKVPKQYRLTPEAAAAHPNADQPPIAHDALPANPAGQGYTTAWYVKASGFKQLLAPQIEDPARTFRHETFERLIEDTLPEADRWVAGMGIRPKGHPDRAKLVGTIDQAFIESDASLPHDFDFAVWNAAWPDQQVEALQGDERIILTNLCAPDAPATERDASGNIRLALSLPPYQPFVLIRYQSGQLTPTPLAIDTVVIEPDVRRVSLVYRAVISQLDPVRVLEARQMPLAEWQAAVGLHEQRSGFQPEASAV